MWQLEISALHLRAMYARLAEMCVVCKAGFDQLCIQRMRKTNVK